MKILMVLALLSGSGNATFNDINAEGVVSQAGALSSLWYHNGEVTTTISTQNAFVKITAFVNTGPQDSLGNVVGDPTTDDDITISLAGTYNVAIQSSFRNSSGAAQSMKLAVRVILATAPTVTDATNATPIVVTTSAAHGIKQGDMVTISGVGGNTAANGDFMASAVNATTITLQDLAHSDTTGNGAYTSGGSVDACYPGNVLVERKVSASDLGRGAGGGNITLEVGDVLEAVVANLDGTGNFVTTQIILSAGRI